MNTNLESQIKDTAPNINITPLIDILLVLLIIFMVISPLKPSRFETRIPSEPTQGYEDGFTYLLVVTIDENLKLKLNNLDNLGTVDDGGKLYAELAEVFRQRKEMGVFRNRWQSDGNSTDQDIEKTVFIKAPRSINYGAVAKVIDGVKGAGANPIALQIDDLTQ
jgi:biopolymer transport protein ExbD